MSDKTTMRRDARRVKEGYGIPRVSRTAAGEEHGVQWYPRDLSLPFLAHPPGQLRSTLRAAGLRVHPSDVEPERLVNTGRLRPVDDRLEG